MNFDLDQRTILKVQHGSFAYGTNGPQSDIDHKGVCIEPLAHQVGFLHSFEQFESKDPVDLVVYSLRKFAKMAADCNPNIIEILFVDEQDVLFADKFGQRLRALGPAFLSKKAKHTFSGYAHAQLKKIRSHRTWLFNPPTVPPTRKEFGLPEDCKVSQSELGALDASIAKGIEIEMPKELLTLLSRERQYQAAKAHWTSYQNWLVGRNPARAELERKFGYDTKHGMHLIRLMRMCREILANGQVLVRRPDAEELIAIRNGALTYDQLVEQATSLERKCDELYKTSTLRHEPDRTWLDKQVADLALDYAKIER